MKTEAEKAGADEWWRRVGCVLETDRKWQSGGCLVINQPFKFTKKRVHSQYDSPFIMTHMHEPSSNERRLFPAIFFYSVFRK